MLVLPGVAPSTVICMFIKRKAVNGVPSRSALLIAGLLFVMNKL